MASPSEEFFQQYADAFSSGDEVSLANMFLTPAVIMSDESKTVYSTTDMIQQAVNAMLERCQEVGVFIHVPEVSQIIRLSDTILFANVYWRMLGKDDKVVFTCSASYTLQRTEQDTLKIIVAVIDDGEKEIEKLLAGN